MNSKIFISKPEHEVQELNDFCNSIHYELIAHSFLSFEPVTFSLPTSNFEVIFFGSKRAVQFFFQQHSIPSKVLIACVGETTAKELLKYKYKVDFIGVNSGDIQQTTLDFKKWLNGKKVLFALTEDSKKSFTKVLNEGQFVEAIVYKTLISSSIIPECRIYIFSSPSNAEGFLKLNELPENSIVIAWGTTTEDYLEQRGIRVTKTLKTASIAEIMKLEYF